MHYEPTVNSTGGVRLEDKGETKIELKDVQFHYPSKKDVQVLKGVTIQVDNKEKRVIALVG